MMRTHRRAMVGAVTTALTLSACADSSTAPEPAPLPPAAFAAMEGGDEIVGYSSHLTEVNRQLAASGMNVMISRLELLRSETAAPQSPNIVLASNHTKRMPSRWVQRDIRRLSTSNELTYGVFAPWATATVGGSSQPAIDNAVSTWNAVSCSNVRATKKQYVGGLPPAALLTGLFPQADINVVGWVPAALIDAIFGPGTSAGVIGITSTFTFIEVGPGGVPLEDADGNRIPTDVDHDGRDDTAFKEIWFNDALAYSTSGAPGTTDLESAFLHEFGHALERGHFGRIAGNLKTLKLTVSPRAVMNAAYVGPLRELTGTDAAGLCSDFASWK